MAISKELMTTTLSIEVESGVDNKGNISYKKNPSQTLSPFPLFPTVFNPSFQSPEPILGSPFSPKFNDFSIALIVP